MKTKLRKKKIASVIRQDATLANANWEYGTKKFCVIGGLLHFAGWDVGNESRHAVVNQLTPEARELLKREYGLSQEQLEALQITNDEHKRTRERRLALLKLLKGW